MDSCVFPVELLCSSFISNIVNRWFLSELDNILSLILEMYKWGGLFGQWGGFFWETEQSKSRFDAIKPGAASSSLDQFASRIKIIKNCFKTIKHFWPLPKHNVLESSPKNMNFQLFEEKQGDCPMDLITFWWVYGFFLPRRCFPWHWNGSKKPPHFFEKMRRFHR